MFLLDKWFKVLCMGKNRFWGNMFSNIFEDGRAFILRNFPERQIYLRSGGEVSYFVLHTRTQVAAATGVVFVALWCLFTIFNLLWGVNPFTSPAQKIKLKEAEYQRLLEDAQAKYANAQVQLQEQQKTFEVAAKSFQEKHAAIAQFSSHTGIQAEQPTLTYSNYASGKILVTPNIRDVADRRARKDFKKVAELNIDNTLDLPLENLDKNQNQILQTAEDQTLESIERMRAIINSTDLDLETVLSLGSMGAGGPLLDVDNVNTEMDSESRITNIKARAYEARQLDEALKSMPLAHPVDADHYRTSSFGVRKDPFTKRPAMHEALDFASYRGAPIVATADGVVVKAGRNGSYGKMIEIDHGHGFVTRYAHLEKTFVKRGQQVKKGDKLGGMGSTGRSTSTHLHYEVRFQGRVYDPDTFLRAGRHVQ